MKKKTLSSSRKGIFLAAIAGIAGGPLGIIASPLALMYINKAKKNGNRFLIWSLVGIPATLSLLIAQFIVLALFAFMQPPSKYNGMSKWAGSQAAKEAMPEPDWCVYTSKPGPPDDISYFECYSRDMSTLAENDHQVIYCYEKELNKRFACRKTQNKQFSSEEMNENKTIYGRQ